MSDPSSKAEARRLKILAKKNARMAYAAGAIATPPSITPAIPPEPLPTSAPPAPLPASTLLSTLPFASFPSLGVPLSRTPFPSAPAAFRAIHSLPRRAELALLLCLAVALALCARPGSAYAWDISAVKLFAYAEVGLLVPSAIARLARRGTTGGTGGGSVLGVIMSVSEAVGIVQKVWADFALFMTAFLCMWHVLTAW